MAQQQSTNKRRYDGDDDIDDEMTTALHESPIKRRRFLEINNPQYQQQQQQPQQQSHHDIIIPTPPAPTTSPMPQRAQDDEKLGMSSSRAVSGGSNKDMLVRDFGAASTGQGTALDLISSAPIQFTLGTDGHARTTARRTSSNSARLGVSSLKPAGNSLGSSSTTTATTMDVEDDEVKQPAAAAADNNGGDGEGVSESFEFLLHQFANLNIPKKGIETCPLCFKTVSLDEFATHVYMCVQLQEDQELAQRMQQEEQRLNNNAMVGGGGGGGDNTTSGVAARVANQQLSLVSHGVPVCNSGLQCKSESRVHYDAYIHPATHPLASATPDNHGICIICAENIPLPLYNAHINACLEVREKPEVIGEVDDGPTTWNVSSQSWAPAPTSTSTQLNQPIGAGLRGPTFQSFHPQHAKFGSFRGGGDDTDDDDNMDGGGGALAATRIDSPTAAAAAAAAAVATSSTSPSNAGLQRGTSMNAAQLSACASLALRVRATSSDPKMFHHVLSQMQRLGFNEENLKAALPSAAAEAAAAVAAATSSNGGEMQVVASASQQTSSVAMSLDDLTPASASSSSKPLQPPTSMLDEDDVVDDDNDL